MKTKLIIATAMMATTAMAQPKLTPQNIDQVLKEMTLQEKATMLVGYTFGNKLRLIVCHNAGDAVFVQMTGDMLQFPALIGKNTF